VLSVILDGGLLGAWMGCAINSFLAAGILLWRFRRGTWQTIRI
jgi:Na+-driven multidrug efflux pump